MSSPSPTITAPPSRARQALALLRALVRRHPRLFAIAVAGSAVFAVFTVLSSAAVEWVTDHVIVPRFEDGQVSQGAVATGVALVMGIALVRAVGVVVRRSWAGKAQWRTAESLTDDVVDRLSRQPAPWMRRHPTGQLIARAGVDVEAATAVMAPMPFSFGVVVMVVVACIWLLTTDVVMGLVALVVFPALAALNIVYQRRVGEHFDEAQHQLGELSAAVHESFEGVMVVKAFGAERRETERLASIASRLRAARIRAVRIRSSFESLLDAIPTVVNIGLVVLGAARVEAGAMTVGAVTSVVYLFTIMVFPLRIIGYGLSELPYSVAGHERVRALLDDPVEADPTARLEIAPAGIGLRMAGVRTSHDDSRDVLEGVDLEVAAGQTVAIVGATGAGKTTLLHVVEGLIPPTEGRVATHEGTRCLVFQEPFLLAASVRENLALGLEVDDGALWHALDLAGAGAFVRSLPQGLATVVGERGVGLSGGQRQRIALARALVRAPALLLLDDTTSALDPETEVRVLANLRVELTDTTVLAVASRPSTIALADQVVYLRDGRVAAQGTHTQLLTREPAYRELMASFEHDRDAADDETDPVVVGGAS